MRAQRLCGVLLLPIVLCGASAEAKPTRPNIVLILADDVGREVLNCYGGTSYRTPNIDRLAAEGIRFDHAYAMPVCFPTRLTLLTGQYHFRHGHPDWGTFPREAEGRTLAALLKRVGYATAVGGKWQLAMLKDDVEQPHRMGFDEYCLYGWHEGPWYYEPHIRENGRLRDDVEDEYGPDVICDFLIDFISKEREQPFFAFYSMSLCHAETNDLDKPAPVGPAGRYDSYAEMVTKMDNRVGRIVTAVDQLGLRDNTLIIFTSDNGTAGHTLIDSDGDEYVYEDVFSEYQGRHIQGGKATLSDWGTRVPMIVRWHSAIAGGQTSGNLVDVSDVLPSLVDVAGGTLPTDVPLDGRSLVAQLCDNAPAREWVFSEYKDDCFVRNQRWKLYRDGRLYDMEMDPDEIEPITAKPRTGGAARAREELTAALAEVGFVPPQD